MNLTDTFDAAGPAGAPAIVLVHGSVVTRKIWIPQLRGLSDTFHVIAPDLPGHGARAAQPFTFDAAIAVLVDIICREAGGRALVVGLSLGGYVAMALGARRPAMVTGLVLSGCSINFRGLLGVYLRSVAALMRWGWLTQSRTTAERKTRRLFSPALSDVADAQLRAGVYPEALAPAFSEMAGKDFTADLAAFPGPSLILNGARDKAAARGARTFVAAASQGRLQTIANAGHACSLDQPDAFNRAVREFAGSLETRS